MKGTQMGRKNAIVMSFNVLICLANRIQIWLLKKYLLQNQFHQIKHKKITHMGVRNVDLSKK